MSASPTAENHRDTDPVDADWIPRRAAIPPEPPPPQTGRYLKAVGLGFAGMVAVTIGLFILAIVTIAFWSYRQDVAAKREQEAREAKAKADFRAMIAASRFGSLKTVTAQLKSAGIYPYTTEPEDLVVAERKCRAVQFATRATEPGLTRVLVILDLTEDTVLAVCTNIYDTRQPDIGPEADLAKYHNEACLAFFRARDPNFQWPPWEWPAQKNNYRGWGIGWSYDAISANRSYAGCPIWSVRFFSHRWYED